MWLHRSLSVLLIWLFFLLRLIKPQLEPSSLMDARALDWRLQGYAFQAFRNPKTGVVYNADLPSNLTGIEVSAMRLRSGSLKNKGVTFKEFQIPVGVIEKPFVERLVLEYQNLGNWSSVFYSLSGYVFIAPVLGLLAYDASNLSANGLPEIDIEATNEPISIRFVQMKTIPDGSVPRCVSIGLQGFVNFSNMLPENTCTTFQQGHFSVVMQSLAPSPSPLQPNPLPTGSYYPPQEVYFPSGSNKGKTNHSKIWIIIGSAIGGLALLVMLGLVLVWALKLRKKKKLVQMEKAADSGETLNMTRIGSTKAPAATVTRTQPTLETEYVP